MASKYLQKYPIPDKFPAILEDFTKEVLRDQPDNIEAYSFYYFKALEEVISYFYVQGKPFVWKKKGKKIPPPKDRIPSTQMPGFGEYRDEHVLRGADDKYVSILI